MSTTPETLDLAWLKRFCPRDTSHSFLTEPAFIDGHACAANGHYMVRIPSEPFADTWAENQKDTIRKTLEKATGEWFSLRVPKGDYLRMEKCERCGGSGIHTCHTCYHEDDCADCDGTGEVAPSVSTDIEGVRFDVATLSKVWALPGFRIQINPAGHCPAQYFRFDGGDGLVMPIRRDLATTVIVGRTPYQEPANV